MRDRPTASGMPSAARLARLFEQREVVRDAFAESESRIDRETRRVDTRVAARRTRVARKALTSATTSS